VSRSDILLYPFEQLVIYTVKTQFSVCECNTGEHDLVIFNDTPLNNHINGELSTRFLH